MSVSAPVLGEVFAGRFELQTLLIESPLGPGFRAYDRDVDDIVALLVLDDAAMAGGAVELLRDQVRLARRVTHRNIARTYDIGEHEGRRFVTLEYIDGVRLRAWLEAQPGQAEIIDLAAQLADGLAAAHEADVNHCNLAPISIMVDRGGRAVLGNFGVSQCEVAQTLAQVTDRVDDMLCSVAYLAPEQILGQPPTSAVDVYALGLLLYEMLSGQRRFGGRHPVVVANARLDDDLADLATNPRIPAEIAELLSLCLAREPSERVTAEELGARLRQALRQLTGTDNAVAPPVSDPVSSSHHDSLAVLPFRYRGPRESDYLAGALFDELVDLLSQTRGLRVLGTGATANLVGAGDRDAKQLGEQLGVDVIVDGTILLAADRLRISARLIEVAGGFQLWHERFEGGVADVFELQDKLAKRIAEALRVELEIIAHRGSADAVAIESYLRGRQAHLRWVVLGPDGAIAHYRAALARAPLFKPALAHLAVACVLAWFQRRPEGPDDIDWERATELAVEQAMDAAPELPETRLAAGNLALQRGDFRGAALNLSAALDVAPTSALAHEFLGRLLLESGRVARGLEHLELAIELDPLLSYLHADIARHCALCGDLDGFRARVELLLEFVDDHRPAMAMLHMRVGAWTRDRALIQAGLDYLTENNPRSASLRGYGEELLDPSDPATYESSYMQQFAAANSPRLRTLVEQLAAEQAALHGQVERALTHLQGAAELVLIDIEWLDRCPLFEGLRERAEFVQVRAQIRERCAQIWSVIMSATH